MSGTGEAGGGERGVFGFYDTSTAETVIENEGMVSAADLMKPFPGRTRTDFSNRLSERHSWIHFGSS